MTDLRALERLSQPIFYITNDPLMAVGLENVLPNYHIVCLDDHPIIDELEKFGVSVFSLERHLHEKNVLFRSSGTILGHGAVLAFIKEKSKGQKPNILFFKPQRKIEIVALGHNFNLIGNSVDLNRLFEDKLSFFEICLKENLPVPPGEIAILSKVDFENLKQKYGLPMVIQFGRGWAGNSTFFIEKKEDFDKIAGKLGLLKVKIMKFIEGITVLNNCAIYNKKVFVGSPAIQVKANKLLTSKSGGTGGRQWPANLDKSVEDKIFEISQAVGKIMSEKGYQGFFGLDFLVTAGGEVFLSENNARLTASTSFFTELELKNNLFPFLGLHILSFLDFGFVPKILEQEPEITGSEIVCRNNLERPVKVMGEVKTGLYDLQLNFVKETYFLDSEEGNLIWVNAAAVDRIVNPEIELLKIQSLRSVCDNFGQLLPESIYIVEKLKEKLQLKNV